MSKEQINLSDALDLIAQSKGDIKTSVQGKGGTIGYDITEYSESIDNIQFRSIRYGNDSIDLSRYSSDSHTTEFNISQYLDGEESFPNDITINDNEVDFMTFTSTNETDYINVQVTPNDYGTGRYIIMDNIGNVEYFINMTVPSFNMNISIGYATGFINFEGSIDYQTVYWDETANSFIIQCNLSDEGGQQSLDLDDFNVTVGGEIVNNELISVQVVTKVEGDSDFNLVITPNDGFPTGEMTVEVSDGTSTGNLTIMFAEDNDESNQITFSGEPDSNSETVDNITYDSVVYGQSGSYNAQMLSENMHYSSNGYYYFTASEQNDKNILFRVDADLDNEYQIDVITFVNLDESYRSTFAQNWTFAGSVVVDGNNLIWTNDYTEGYNNILFPFTQLISTVGQNMYCDEVIITVSVYATT